MSDGWIKLHRAIKDSRVWDLDGETFKLYVSLCLDANRKTRYAARDNRYIKRGELVIGLQKYADHLNISVRQLRTRLDYLVRTEKIIVEGGRASAGTHITICDYETWNPRKTKNDKSATSERQVNDKSATSERQVNDNLQEGKESKERKKGRSNPQTPTGGFAAFWEAVHQKTGKQVAERAYRKAVARLRIQGTANPDAYLLEAMTAFAESPAASPTDHTPIHPATWLNQGRYEDDRETWQRNGNGKLSLAEQLKGF